MHPLEVPICYLFSLVFGLILPWIYVDARRQGDTFGKTKAVVMEALLVASAVPGWIMEQNPWPLIMITVCLITGNTITIATLAVRRYCHRRTAP